jgi:hypothetical protein
MVGGRVFFEDTALVPLSFKGCANIVNLELIQSNGAANQSPPPTPPMGEAAAANGVR